MHLTVTHGGYLAGLVVLGTRVIPAAPAAETETVEVGIYQNPPKVFIDGTGNPQGFWVDLLDAMAQSEEWTVEYVPCDWDACLEAVDQGHLDLMVDVAYSESRDQRFDFNQEVVFASWSAVYTHPDVEIESILDLDQKRVAVLRDSIQYEALATQAESFDIQPQFVEVASFEAMFELLQQRAVDAGVVNRFFGEMASAEYQVKRTNILISPTRVHFITAKGDNSHLLAAIDNQLQVLTRDSNSVYYRALERWLQPERGVGWQQVVRHHLTHIAVYTPIIGLLCFALWNRALRREVRRRKEIEWQLQQQDAQNRAILAAVPDFMFRVGADGVYRGFVVPHRESTLVPDRDIAGHTMAELLPADIAERQMHYLQQALATGEIQVYEQTLVVDDHPRHEEVRVVKSDEDEVLLMVRDISDRKASERALRDSEVRYRKVVEAQTDFILRSRPDTTITFANPALCKALGVSLDKIVGKPWNDFANVDDLEQGAFQALSKLSPDNPRCFVENRDIRADGQVGWTQWLNEAIFDDSGQLIEIQSVGRDITKLKQAEQALRDSEETLRLVTENMSDLVCLHAPDGRYLYVTPSSQALLGYPPEDLIGQDPYDLFHPDDRELIRRSSHTVALAGHSTSITYRIRQKNGEYIWLETIAQPILNAAGQVIHLQSTSREISDRVQMEQQLKHDALHDRLTGLPNRTLLMERLDLALKRAKRHGHSQFAVMFLDLDHFKVINDSLGHLAGDELLISVAAILRRVIRDTDLAVRLGGDEFVLLLEDITDVAQAVDVAERILAILQLPLPIADHEVFTDTSIGIVVGSAVYQNAEELVRNSDLAMYQAKQQGRGQYAIFDPEMHQQMMQRLQIENDLRKALGNQEFLLHYQPIVCLKTQQVRGFEALLRWQHPQKGLMLPGEFIRVAEETGLIIPIGEWILQTTCQQLTQWQAVFPSQVLEISVNLSVKQLQGPILKHVATALAASNLQKNSLALEITESMLMENIDVTYQLLAQIKAQSVRLSIDDFGTGYSSLSYLHRLPVDYLKIDRTFVSSDQVDGRNQTIAESIITLSNLLDLKAIAEGIETPQQLQWLAALGCELGQGHLFRGAMSAEDATQYLHQQLPQ
ncbi:GGDEF domain-containing protein [Halomicronema hongdechloris C2206]|uniref:GGDEF domain-containing protein n=1 Tax=Halomicronema hongdechloris C2206 TaxID=1641165 RepID=A0A1Z3HKR7_9CYAN|nr:EAL domain-containing protein [Halomicronema hongdechloris]ASC70885.1 GGDEF domain-containing protein [Halomicronema hongdechloris C2206]